MAVSNLDAAQVRTQYRDTQIELPRTTSQLPGPAMCTGWTGTVRTGKKLAASRCMTWVPQEGLTY